MISVWKILLGTIPESRFTNLDFFLEILKTSFVNLPQAMTKE